MQVLPKVVPINEMKNTAQFSKLCNESSVPVLVTKNGYGDLVVMNVKLYEETIAKMQAALLINQALDNIANGGATIPANEVYKQLDKKYGL